MKHWKKITIPLGILIVGWPLAIAALFIHATNDMCGNEIYTEVLSPDKRHKAVVFQRDCGATTEFSTQISITDANDELKNESGNILIMRGHPRDVSPEASWLSITELRIERDPDGSEYKAEGNWGFMNKIKVSYGAGSS